MSNESAKKIIIPAGFAMSCASCQDSRWGGEEEQEGEDEAGGAFDSLQI